MDKSRIEITSLANTDDSYSIIKKDKSNKDYNILIGIGVSLISAWIAISILLPDGRQFNLYFIMAIAVMMVIAGYFISGSRYILQISKKDLSISAAIKFGPFSLGRRNSTISDSKQLSIVRLSSSNAVQARGIRKYIYGNSKFKLYLIFGDRDYMEIISFNNFVEAKTTAEELGKLFNVKVSDTTSDEYIDEDHYFSSYFHYRDLVDEVKNEK